MGDAFTPGPWVIENPMEPDLAIVEAGKETYEWAGRFVAHVPHYEKGEWEPGHFSTAEIHANARLMAAAPDMLEALRLAEKCLVGAYGEPDPAGPRSLESLEGRQAILTVRAALAKTGGAA